MKKLLLVVLIFTSSLVFSQDFPNIYHGLSLGSVSFNITPKDSELGLELFSYRVIEQVSGLGLTTYIWPVFIDSELEDSDILLYPKDLFALELNWEPTFNPDTFWGLGLYFRADNYLPNGNSFSWKTGARIDARVNLGDFIYPIVSFETGYRFDDGIYMDLKIDPVVLIAFGAFMIGQTEKDDYIKDNNPEEYYPNGESREDQETIQKWMLSPPE